jgi:hypothetical protein
LTFKENIEKKLGIYSINRDCNLKEIPTNNNVIIREVFKDILAFNTKGIINNIIPDS